MRYTVDTLKARKIYRTTEIAAKAMVALMAIMPLSACITMLCFRQTIGWVFGGIALSAIIGFVVALFLYLYGTKHVATRYVELIDGLNPTILGCHVRNARGSDGYDGLQEVYFTYANSRGQTEEFVLGLVTEVTQHNLESPMVDITSQKFYV